MEYNSRHIPILDGIRAYAVLSVCIFHFFLVDESGLYEANRFLGSFLFKASQLGLRGVELFFILSGFLITGILIDTKKSPQYFTTFYARRFLRIFPLYYFVLSISFLVLPYFIQVDTGGREIIDKQAWLWTYTSNLSEFFGQGGWESSKNFPIFTHFWSLCVEEHFYLLWPLLVYLANDKWLHRIMWGFVIFSGVSALVVYFNSALIPILKWTSIQYAGVLSLGGLIAWYWRRPPEFERIARIALKFVWYAGLLFFLFNLIPRKYEIRYLLTFFSSIIFFSLILIVSLNGNKLTNRLFKHRLLYFIGKISYGIYVYHYMLSPYFVKYIYTELHFFLRNGILSVIAYSLICTIISISIAWLSWSLLESQILKLKGRLSY